MNINRLSSHVIRRGLLFILLMTGLFCQVRASVPAISQIIDKQVYTVLDTSVTLTYNDTLSLPSGKDFELNVRMKPAAQVSAISLGFYFPEEFLAIDSMKLKEDRGGYHMIVEDSLFRMVWSDINPISVDENDTIITLYMRSLDLSALSNTIKLVLYEMSEFADASAMVIEDVELEIPEIKYFTSGPDDTISAYSVRVYPNPFIEYTTVDITLKSESRISMSLYSRDGKEVLSWEEQSYSKGNHLLKIYETDLSKGIYFLKVWIKNDEISATKMIKLMSLE
jgi:hypothetical protein